MIKIYRFRSLLNRYVESKSKHFFFFFVYNACRNIVRSIIKIFGFLQYILEYYLNCCSLCIVCRTIIIQNTNLVKKKSLIFIYQLIMRNISCYALLQAYRYINFLFIPINVFSNFQNQKAKFVFLYIAVMPVMLHNIIVLLLFNSSYLSDDSHNCNFITLYIRFLKNKNIIATS